MSFRPGGNALAGVMCCAALWGCRQPQAPPHASVGWFEELAGDRAPQFVHQLGDQSACPMPGLMGSGGALFDYDGDGLLDVVLLQNAGPGSDPKATGATHRLFHQDRSGGFLDVTAGSGLDVSGYGMGVTAGDIDNDGRVDLFITEFEHSRLLLNRGNGKFTDVSTTAGVLNRQWGTAAALFDYDRDGRLDLVVVNYVDYTSSRHCTDQAGLPEYCGPDSFPGTVTRLFHNVSQFSGPDGVRFEDVTARSGVGSVAGPGLGVVCLDFDGDRWLDIFVANDGKPNHLWINQHDGTFREQGALRGVSCNALGESQANMGVAVADVDGDGMFDLYVTHLTEQRNVLWKQGPRGMFLDRTAVAGLTHADWRGTGFGTVAADFDLDGRIDLALANGRVTRSRLPAAHVSQPANLTPHWQPYAERNQLFAGRAGGKFADISSESPALGGAPNVARGLALGDYDNDGALDLLLTRVDAPAALLHNVAPRQGHWLMVRAIEPACGGRDSPGAQVTLVCGESRRVGWVLPSCSYLVSNDPRVHFGLGPIDSVERIEVLWPDGSDETFACPGVDRLIVLGKGKGTALEP